MSQIYIKLTCTHTDNSFEEALVEEDEWEDDPYPNHYFVIRPGAEYTIDGKVEIISDAGMLPSTWHSSI